MIYFVSLNGVRVEQRDMGAMASEKPSSLPFPHWRLYQLSFIILDQHLGYRYPTLAVAPDNQYIHLCNATQQLICLIKTQFQCHKI